jgi:hypothetical protein
MKEVPLPQAPWFCFQSSRVFLTLIRHSKRTQKDPGPTGVSLSSPVKASGRGWESSLRIGGTVPGGGPLRDDPCMPASKTCRRTNF